MLGEGTASMFGKEADRRYGISSSKTRQKTTTHTVDGPQLVPRVMPPDTYEIQTAIDGQISFDEHPQKADFPILLLV